MNDYAVIPIHHQVSVWASRKNVQFAGRTDERTYVFDFALRP